MHMFFWYDYNIEDLLFYGFSISSVSIFVITCLGFFGGAILFEYLKMLQAQLKQIELMITQRQIESVCPSESDTLITNNPQPSTSTATAPVPSHRFYVSRKNKFLLMMGDIALWLSQSVLGYMLMLTVMFYNVYLVISIILGSAVGYFIFGPTLMKINIDNCRSMRSTFCMSDCGEPDRKTLLKHNVENDPESVPPCHRNRNNTPACNLTTTPVASPSRISTASSHAHTSSPTDTPIITAAVSTTSTASTITTIEEDA